jgi:hypothetical protein
LSSNSRSASQDIPLILYNMMVHSHPRSAY